MTTKVTIEACCPDDTEVIISITDESQKLTNQITIQSGEEYFDYIYDNRHIFVKELKKSTKSRIDIIGTNGNDGEHYDV